MIVLLTNEDMSKNRKREVKERRLQITKMLICLRNLGNINVTDFI